MENTLVIKIKKSRIDNLYDEIRQAINKTSTEELKLWGKDSGILFLKLAGRRAKGLLNSIGHLLKFSATEIFNFLKAIQHNRFKTHIIGRGKTVKRKLSDITEISYKFLTTVVSNLFSNPKEYAPKLFVVFIGFLMGSGGFDGDGGIPDTDLKVGIGRHRSIFTHSLLPALIIETVAFSLVGLVDIVHKNLPKNHDPFWDKLKFKNKELTTGFVAGTCAGIAYHLLADMNPTADTIKPYSDLPFSTTMEGHQAIFGANAVVEIIDLKNKDKN